MKKAISLFFCLMIMLCPFTEGLASGVNPNLWETPTVTPTATPVSGVFTFRNGIQWNMSREIVKALETVELTERIRDNWSILLPLASVQVSKYTAELVYMFYNDQLKMISYNFGNTGTEGDYQYLTGALDSLYGDHFDPDASSIINIIKQIYPDPYTADQLQNRRGWIAGDDTIIYLYYYAENAYEILYACATGSGIMNYDTTGL